MENTKKSSLNILAAILLSILGISNIIDIFRYSPPARAVLVDLAFIFAIVLLFIGKRKPITGIGFIVYGGALIISNMIWIVSSIIDGYFGSIIVSLLLNLLNVAAFIVGGIMIIKMFSSGKPSKIWFLPALLLALPVLRGLIADISSLIDGWMSFGVFLLDLVFYAARFLGLFFAMKWAVRVCGSNSKTVPEKTAAPAAPTYAAPAAQPNAMLFCPKCGSKLADGAQFCAVCGEHLNAPAPRPQPAPAPAQTVRAYPQSNKDFSGVTVRYRCPNGHTFDGNDSTNTCPQCGAVLEKGGYIQLYRMGNYVGCAIGMDIHIDTIGYGLIGNTQSLRISVPYGEHLLHVTHTTTRKCNDPTVLITPEAPTAYYKAHFTKAGFAIQVDPASPDDMPTK